MKNKNVVTVTNKREYRNEFTKETKISLICDKCLHGDNYQKCSCGINEPCCPAECNCPHESIYSVWMKKKIIEMIEQL